MKVHNELNAILLRAWKQMKMGKQNGLYIMKSEQLNYNSKYFSSVKCLSCSDLESQFKEALLEISSQQYINKLLYKELNNGASMNTLDEWKKTAARSQILTLKCNHYIKRSSAALQPQQTVPITNKFSVLKNLSDSTTRHDATASEGKRTMDGLTYNYKRMRIQKKLRI